VFYLSNVIIARDLTKIYDNRIVALKNINLEIKKGEIFSILGPNGAGKTTFIKIIIGHLKPTIGYVKVLGVPVNELLNSEIRFKISYVPQENMFWENLTVIENMKFMASLYELPRKLAEKRIKRLLNEFNLAKHSKLISSKLSGGMKRKLAIAMSLLNDPEILILDEPTTGLDPRARAELLADIEVLKERGKTIIITTHIIDEAERLSDRVAIIDEGRIIDVASPTELKSKICGERVLDVLLDTSLVDDVEGVLESTFEPEDYVRVGDRLVIKLDGRDVRSVFEFFEGREFVLSTTVRRSTLEDAFLFLTGKSLR